MGKKTPPHKITSWAFTGHRLFHYLTLICMNSKRTINVSIYLVELILALVELIFNSNI